jgi:hypothetical protein
MFHARQFSAEAALVIIVAAVTAAIREVFKVRFIVLSTGRVFDFVIF